MKELKIIVIDCGSCKVDYIVEALHACQSAANKISLAQANDFDFALYDAVVISGGPKLFTDPNQFTELEKQFRFIATLTRPTLGICLGHQAIGLAYGSEIFLGEARRCPESIARVAEHPLLARLARSFVVTEDHCEGITLPDGFTLLASSDYYAVEAMACQEKQLYGVQFHPEVSPKTGAILFENFCEMVRGMRERKGVFFRLDE